MLQKLALLLFLPALLPAQNISCALSGTIQDPGGAVMAGVKVTLTSESNGFVRRATTTNEGFFSFPDLTPATFSLSIDTAGFKRYVQTGIEIGSGQQRSLGRIPLQIGAVTEAVTVSAEVASVNLASGEKSGTLTSDQLENLALRGRDIFDAISLLPGVVDTSDGRDAPGPTSIGNIFVNGGRNDAKNMTIDGVTNLDTGSNGSVHSMPSMDSVAELRLLASNYAAEYGRNAGGTITVITKGGSKLIKGSASWYYRHESLNANDFFNNLAGRDRTPYRYNIAGYTIGGPILIPKLTRDRNKLFFFFSQEFQHQKVQYGTKTVTVPSALERQGDFSQSYNTNGTLIGINDPLNGKKPFPGFVIPASRLTKTGQNILNLFPLPNYVDPEASRRYNWNYFSAGSGGYPRRTEAGRIDYAPRANWQLYARVQNNSDEQHTPYTTWVTGSLNFPLTPIVFNQPGKGATVHSQNTITPTMFNELLVGVSQNTLTFYPEDVDKVNRDKLGIDIPQRNPALNPLRLIPNMTFGSISNAANPSMNDGTPYFNRNTIFQVSDHLSKVWETHTIKTGISFERTQKFQSASSVTRGTIKFDRDTVNALDANNAYANALLGNYDSYAEANARPQGSYLFTNTEFYLQDTWRARRNLSLDYGVRVYHDPPQYDTRHQLASFNPGLYKAEDAPVLLRPATVNGVKVAIDPRSGTTFPSGLIGAYAPGYGNPANGSYIGGKDGYPEGLYSTPALTYAPRIGFAWDPFGTGRTSIRGGGGVFFDRIEGNPTMGQITNPPVIYTPTQYYGSFDDIAVTAKSGLLAPTGSITSLGGKGQVQTTYNFSLSIQRQIARTTLAEVAYVGSLSRHLLWQRNINPVPLGSNFLNLHPENRDPTTTNSALSPNFLRPYQGLGDVLLYEFASTSNYNSMQASLSQRYRRGVNFGVSYTFSKTLDAADSYSNTVDPFLDPRHRNYGPAGYDRTHVFSANYNWALPKVGRGVQFRPLHWIADNWSLSGVTRLQSGAPYTPGFSLVNGVDTTGSSSAQTRPSIKDPNAANIADRFQPIVIGTAQPPTPLLGNAGKNILKGPGMENFDMTLSKSLHLTERINGQLRFETYNTFNHTQFSAIDNTLRFDNKGVQVNPVFGEPTQARPPRRISLALRLNF